MRRNLLILVIGLLLLSYGQFFMAEFVEQEHCINKIESQGSDDCEKTISDIQNPNRDPVRLTGAVIAIGGLFLIVGD